MATIHQATQGGKTEMYYNTRLFIVQLLKIFADCAKAMARTIVGLVELSLISRNSTCHQASCTRLLIVAFSAIDLACPGIVSGECGVKEYQY